MKKITILLCISVFIFTCNINSMENAENLDMDVDNNSNTEKSRNTSQQNNQLEKLLKKQLESTNNTNVLLHTLILQNKTHFEYEDSLRHDTRQPIDKHAKDTQLAVDNIYKSANTKLKDKTLHIPMTGKTEIAKTTKNKDTEGII